MGNFMGALGQSATRGERTFYNYIEAIYKDTENCFCYVEPQIDEKRPDFVLLSPTFGVLIVEIKDNSPEKLVELTQAGPWKMLKDENYQSIPNPFDQIYRYWRIIKNKVNFSQIPPTVKIPIKQLLIFSQIAEASNLGEQILKLSSRRVHLCFQENFSSPMKFTSFLRDVLPLDCGILPQMFDTIRANIIPQCRLPILTQTNLLRYYTVEDQVKLLDARQERLARKLGEGHRLIFGVAGSGKTIILIARARYLALKYPTWKILILCYNRLLSNYLYQLLNPQNFEADLSINTFHGWAKSVIESNNNEYALIYRKSESMAEKQGRMTDFFKNVVPNLLQKSLGSQPEETRFYFDAILIDEAQDFESPWFEGIMDALNPKTKSLLVACDGLQGIYARKKFTWSSVGIEARGRVKKFSKSYRNPIEIGQLAQCALPTTISDLINRFDEFITTDEFSGRHGHVEFVIAESRMLEYHELATKIQHICQETKTNILVLFRRNIAKHPNQHPFLQELLQLHIAWENLKNFHHQGYGIHIGTVHGTKGLEADIVIIPELDTYTSDENRQLLYVGMTRARSRLILSACRTTPLIQSLQEKSMQ